MAKFHLTNQMLVSELKKEFNDAFGAKLRIYVGRSQVNDDTTLLAAGLKTEGIFECRSSLTCGRFIERMQEEFALKVKIYTCDEWVAVLDGLTLESAGKVKKNAVKADMQSMIAYQHANNKDEIKESEIKTIKDSYFIIDGITYSFNKKGEAIICYGTKLFGDIVIPEEISYEGKNYFVTEWGWSDDDDNEDDGDDLYIDDEDNFDDDDTGFRNNENITSVRLPNSLKNIWFDAISGCPNLTKITIGTGLKKIDSEAFSFCDKLTQIRIYADKKNVECADDAYLGNNEPLFVYGEESIPFFTNTEHILYLFNELSKKDVYTSGFSTDKKAIEKIFKNTLSNTKEDILARLTIIDSMYSTQMNKRYYGLDELADVISHFDNLKELAIQFVKHPNDASIFTCNIKQKGFFSILKTEKTYSLFNEKYGIKKNGDDSGVAISLISKYLYFLTDYQFPIYDSIAMEVFPKLWNYCGFIDMPKYKTTLSSSEDNYGNSAIECFVTAINQLLSKLGLQEEPRKYDILDRIMWFTGKICRGNLSLVISQDDYSALADSYKAESSTNKFDFDIEKADLSKLLFLKENKLLREFFELAKKLGKA